MPIQLTTAFNPGDLDPGKQYTHLAIRHLEHSLDNQTIRLICKYGVLEEGSFVAGAMSPTKTHLIQDEPTADPPGTDYTDLVATQVVSGDVDDLVYDVNAKHLYQYLLDNGEYAGTIS